MRTKLIAARKAKGLSQEQLAARIGRTRSAVAKYETGLRALSGSILQQLRRELGIPIDDILYEEVVGTKHQA